MTRTAHRQPRRSGQPPGDSNAALAGGTAFTVLHSIYESGRLLKRSAHRPSFPELSRPRHDGQPCDPATHVYCIRLAYRLVGIIPPTLRPEAIHDAAAEFYKAVLDEHRHYETQRQARHA
jgi:hypothetical protein